MIEDASAADVDAEDQGIAYWAKAEIRCCRPDLRLPCTVHCLAGRSELGMKHTMCWVRGRQTAMGKRWARGTRVAASWSAGPATSRAMEARSHSNVINADYCDGTY